MFSFFKKKPKEPSFREEDLVWVSKAGKYKAIYSLLRKLPEEERAWVIAFFPKTLDEMEFVLGKAGAAFLRLSENERVSEFQHCLMTADSLEQNLAYLSQKGKSIRIFFIEHHPLKPHEEALNKALSALEVRHQYAESMDSPFMQIFGGERVSALISRLDIPEDEALNSPLITKSISHAQDKIKAHVQREVFCPSIEEWVRENLNGYET